MRASVCMYMCAYRYTYVCMCMYICMYFMRYNMFWVLFMHCQWARGSWWVYSTRWTSHLCCSEVLNIPAQWDLLSVRFVWGPAQIMSVGICTNLEVCGGWCVSLEKWGNGVAPGSQWGCLLYLPLNLEGFTFTAWEYVQSFLRVFESQCDTITTPVRFFPLFCLWENSHSQSWIPLESSVLQMAWGKLWGEALGHKVFNYWNRLASSRRNLEL